MNYIRCVVSSTLYRSILVLSEPSEIKGIAVDEELVPFYFNRLDADRKLICIDDFAFASSGRQNFSLKLVEVRLTRFLGCD